MRRLGPALWPVVWAVLCAVGYGAISLLHYRQAAAASWDNAIFEEAVRGYAGFGPPIVDIKGPHFNLLGDHFSPVIALLGPVYRLFPQAQTLLVAQVVLFGLSVYVISSLATRTLTRWPAGVVSGAYGLSFGLQSAIVSRFHEVAFGVPMIALAGAAFVERRFRAVVGWSMPLLLVKEDLGLTIVAVGAALYLVGERRRGLGLAVAGGAGMLVTLLVLIPMFRDGTGYAYTLGGDGPLANLLTQGGRKLLTLVLTLGVGGFVAVLSPWSLLAVPTLGWRFTADNPYYWGTDFHYAAILMPVMAVAAIDVMRRREWTQIPGMLVLVGVTAFMARDSPVSELLDPDSWRPTPRATAAAAVLNTVPRDVRVDTDIGLIDQLVAGRQVTFIGTSGNARPDWVVLSNPEYGPAAAYATQRYGQRYVRVLQTGAFDVAVTAASSEGRRALRRAGAQ